MARIAVLYGSVREQRQGIKAARFMVRQLEKRGYNVTLVDPKETPLPLLDKRRFEFEGEAPGNIEKIGRVLEEADAFVVVSAEYNHSLPPALKNLLDHFGREFYFKPAGIVTYSAGGFGGVRTAVHLRAVLGELGMATLSTMFPVSKVQEAFDEEGNAVERAYEQRVTQFLDELDWYVAALTPAREQGVPF